MDIGCHQTAPRRVVHERAGDGFQIFNPGSPTERRRAPAHTMGMARAEAGTLDFELIELIPYTAS